MLGYLKIVSEIQAIIASTHEIREVKQQAEAAARATAMYPEGVGNTEAIGRVLYTTYLLPFEVASLILLAAMIGAVILAKKDIFAK